MSHLFDVTPRSEASYVLPAPRGEALRFGGGFIVVGAIFMAWATLVTFVMEDQLTVTQGEKVTLWGSLVVGIICIVLFLWSIEGLKFENNKLGAAFRFVAQCKKLCVTLIRNRVEKPTALIQMIRPGVTKQPFLFSVSTAARETAAMIVTAVILLLWQLTSTRRERREAIEIAHTLNAANNYTGAVPEIFGSAMDSEFSTVWKYSIMLDLVEQRLNCLCTSESKQAMSEHKRSSDTTMHENRPPTLALSKPPRNVFQDAGGGRGEVSFDYSYFPGQSFKMSQSCRDEYAVFCFYSRDLLLENFNAVKTQAEELLIAHDLGMWWGMTLAIKILGVLFFLVLPAILYLEQGRWCILSVGIIYVFVGGIFFYYIFTGNIFQKPTLSKCGVLYQNILALEHSCNNELSKLDRLSKSNTPVYLIQVARTFIPSLPSLQNKTN